MLSTKNSMSTFKIAHITTVHLRYDVRIFMKECRSVGKCSEFAVDLVVADGQGSETVDNVRINDLGVLSGSRLKKTLVGNYKLIKYLSSSQFDCVHFHDPDVFPCAVWMSFKGPKIVYDSHEDLPALVASRGWIPVIVRKPLSRIAKFVETTATKRFAAVVAATPKIALGFPKHKAVLVQNFPLAEEISSDIAKQEIPDNPFNFIYTGAISQIRGLKQVVEALEIANRTVDCRLVIAGSFHSAAFEEELSSMDGWKNVEFVGFLDRSAMNKLLSSATGGIVTYLPTEHHIHAQPNKLYEYMGAGLPVIASNFPLWVSLVSESEPNCGMTVNPADPHAIASLLIDFCNGKYDLQSMGESGRTLVRKKYNWTVEEKTLMGLYSSLRGKV